MSKIRTFTLVSFRNTPTIMGNPLELAVKPTALLSANALALTTGVEQRKNVLPKNLSLYNNKKRIGLYQPNILDHNNNNPWLDIKQDFGTRTVKIFIFDTNHMHNVPVLKYGYKWCIQYERVGVYKNANMGWTYTTDNFSRRLVKFKSLEDAIEYCRNLGLGFEVEYPKFRYHTRKNYGDNFKWKGQPKPDLEDI